VDTAEMEETAGMVDTVEKADDAARENVRA
jgi:hypothetical protein